MTISGQFSYYHIQGGAVPITSLSYVYRQADEDLYNFACSDNLSDFVVCYVLAARQMGKSSLGVHLSHRLREQFICISIDLQGFGNEITEDRLYKNILHLVCGELQSRMEHNLREELNEFWNKYSENDIVPAIRFKEFLQDIILPKVSTKRIIVFIDEIQKLLLWKLNNSFLEIIRSWSESNKNITNRDSHDSQEKTKNYVNCRLKFVLLGVVKPYDLLTDAAFNIGKAVELKNFAENTEPLMGGLTGITEDPERVLKEILWWTGGHPFLTQLVCHSVSQGGLENLTQSKIKETIENFVRSEIIENWRSKDSKRLNHFSEVERWFTQGYTDKAERVKALQLYDSILLDNQLIRFDSSKPECVSLLISGLISKKNQYINVSNPIYKEIFNHKWSKEIKQYLLDPNPVHEILHQILAWIQSYEKAIVSDYDFPLSKKMSDDAFYKFVEQLTENFDFSKYTEPQDNDIDTVIKYCINYLADNLIRLGIWEEDDRPDIIKLDGENRWKITVSNCSYQEECKWALDEPAFDKENEEEKYKKYRCQRLGCCVGAVKKNMTDDKLPVDQKNQLGYFMTTVMESTEEAEKKCRCEGVIFVNKNLKP